MVRLSLSGVGLTDAPCARFPLPLRWQSWNRAGPTVYACRKFASNPGALPRAAESDGSVGISGSGAGSRGCPVLVRRSIEGRTRGPKSAFLWRSDTVSFGAVKRNGVGKTYPQRRSLWLLPTFRTSEK